MNSENHTTPNFSTAATATGKKQEEGVAEAWTNQRKRRESSERGNDDIIHDDIISL